MTTRAWFGSLVWVVCFNLFVAGVAYFGSISWAILIIFIRHILLGVPKVYDTWRMTVVGKEQYSHLTRGEKKWPNQPWILETVFGLLITVASFIWINEPLRLILDRM